MQVTKMTKNNCSHIGPIILLAKFNLNNLIYFIILLQCTQI
jgi:hypothetical protein